jgi:hypothetical protein
MRSVFSGFLKVLIFLLGIYAVYLAIDATVILVRHGYTHIWLAWFVGFIPGFALPLFTSLRWIYVGTWILAIVLAGAAAVIDG